MTETFDVEVLHVVAPDELDEYDLEADLRDLAADRYVLVCRKGGSPSRLELLWAFLRRRPIEAITLVSPTEAEEEEELTVTVEATEREGVYEVVG